MNLFDRARDPYTLSFVNKTLVLECEKEKNAAPDKIVKQIDLLLKRLPGFRYLDAFDLTVVISD